MASAGPVGTSAASHALHAPLGLSDIELAGGVWHRWQEVNRTVSMPMGLRRLEEAGNLHNLRLASGEVTGAFKGPLFMDSDLYKALEAVAWELGRELDPTMSEFLDSVTALLADAQEPDGYLNSWFQVVEPEKKYTYLQSSHEMYCIGHLLQAAVAANRALGYERLLHVACRAADHLVATFLRAERPGIDGHPGVETALIELYRETGKRDYLDLATKLIEERGRGLIGTSGMGLAYLQDHLPVREADTLMGHAVRAMYLECGVVDLYLENGDRSLLEASIRRWEDLVRTKLSLTAGAGSRHAAEAFGDRYELPADRAYNETCAAVALIHWSWRLLLATGQARFGDLIERTLFNAFGASTAVDGTHFFYVNPLQRRGDHSDNDDPGRRRTWFSCACCPPNIMRLVASLQHYFATVRGSDVYVHQYASMKIKARSGTDTAVTLSIETDYPWSGNVTITMEDTPETPWTLALRIPQWSTGTTVEIGGEQAGVSTASGYLELARTWRDGDTVTLRLDVAPRITYPHPRVDAIRGCAAIERGPLVYCFEQPNQDVDIETVMLAPSLRLQESAPIDDPILGRTVTVEAPVLPMPDAQRAALYAASPARSTDTGGELQTARAVPYFQWDNRALGAMRVWMPVSAACHGTHSSADAR